MKIYPDYFGNELQPKMSNYLLLTDLEGIIGVRNLRRHYENGNLLLREIEVTVSSIRAHAENISVCYIHNNGKGLSQNQLANMGVDLIEGIWNLRMQISHFDYAILIGFHGMKNSGGTFDHSFKMDITEILCGNLKIGEVGIYYRWLLLNGVQPLLISGEGNFAEELAAFDCLIHAVSQKRHLNNITEDYEELRRNLYQAIQKKGSSLQLIIDEPISVKVDNSDKYEMLADYKYTDLKNRRFHFPSIDVFLEEIYVFSILLNMAAARIYERNVNFFRHMGLSIEKQTLQSLLSTCLNRDINSIDHSCRTELMIKLKEILKQERKSI